MNILYPSARQSWLTLTACALLLGLLLSCGDNSSEADTEAPAEGDSLTVEIPATSPPVAEAAPDLIGTWQLAEMRLGNTPMSIEEIGEATLTFTAEGQMISATPDLGEETTAFTYQDGLILAEDGLGDRRIEALTPTHLELTVSIDGETVRYRYRRKAE